MATHDQTPPSPETEDRDDEKGPLAKAWEIFGPEYLPYRILMLGKMIDRLTTEQVRTLAGVSLAEWRVMAHLGAMGPTSASGVTNAALVDRAETSRAVRALAAKGFLEKRPNPQNRRSHILVLTPEGQRICRLTAKRRMEFYKALTSALSIEELETVDRLLFSIAEKADAMQNSGLEDGPSD